MKKVILAVDEGKGTEAVIKTFADLFFCARPETVILLYVEKIEGKSVMTEMLGDAELSTLKEELRDTEYQEQLDRKAKAILAHYSKKLEELGVLGIQTAVREGHPADEILKETVEQAADMIIIGSRGKRVHSLLIGSVSREVSQCARIPVLIAR